MWSPLHYWHPVLKSADVGRSPVEQIVAGTPLVFYRTRDGAVAALENRCSHRRMPLHHGVLDGDRIVCPYHACSFAPDGSGRCPTSDSRALSVRSYETREDHGVVWVREAGSDSAFPTIEREGWSFVGSVEHVIDGPLQLVVDNMTELEHTGAVHRMLAFGIDDLTSVRTRADRHGDIIRIFYEGPQRPLSFAFRSAFDVRKGDTYRQDAEIHADPVHSRYTIHWHDPADDTARRFAMRFVIFYVPTTAESTKMYTFAHWSVPKGRWLGLYDRIVGAEFMRTVRYELGQDKAIIEKLPYEEMDIRRFKLGPFDRPMALTRALLAERYWGTDGERGETGGAAAEAAPLAATGTGD